MYICTGHEQIYNLELTYSCSLSVLETPAIGVCWAVTRKRVDWQIGTSEACSGVVRTYVNGHGGLYPPNDRIGTIVFFFSFFLPR